MKRYWPLILLSIALWARLGRADDDVLPYWAANFMKPEVQLKILQRIFPATGPDVSSAILDKVSNTYLFPRGSSWVQLAPSFVWNPGNSNTLIVTCLLRNHRDEPPVNGTSYAISSGSDRATAVTPGYAANEKINKVVLPGLQKSFLVVEDSYPQQSGLVPSSTLFLLDLDPSALRGNPTMVWKNPAAYRYFQIGFAPLSDNGPEELVLRSVTAPRAVGSEPSNSPWSPLFGSTDYRAYRWNGTQFSEDTSAFQNHIRALPEDAWKYGTGK